MTGSRTIMPLTGFVTAGQSANMDTQNHEITRETQILNLPSFYSKKPFPDGVNTNAYNLF